MKFFRSVSVNSNVCPPGVYEEILRLWPEGVRHVTFHLEAKPGDDVNAELVERIVAFCKNHGLDRLRGAYSYLVMPHYEPRDLAAAPLLWLLTQRRMFKGINSSQRDEHGRIVLPATQAKPTVKVASIFPTPWVVVSNAVRRTLESGGLAGMKFEEVAIKGHSMRASADPFWELRSTLTLPKMANSVVDPNIAFDPPRHVIVGADTYGEPHYVESALRGVGPFDIAHTFERLEAGEPFGAGQPALIISQRFYQHCLKHKIPLEARPARIDRD